MKTKVNLIRLLLIAGVVLCSGMEVFAQGPENVSLVALTDKRVVLLARNPGQQPMSVEIANSSTGEIVYNANLLQESSYAKIYNLSNLPEGGYKVSFRIDRRVYEKELLLQDSKPVLLTETKYNLPEFYQDADQLSLTLDNPDLRKVKVSFRKDAESFFTDEPEYKGSFKRNYNLKNLDPGVYSVDVVSGDNSFSHNFEVK
jgi:hypothetical protein